MTDNSVSESSITPFDVEVDTIRRNSIDESHRNIRAEYQHKLTNIEKKYVYYLLSDLRECLNNDESDERICEVIHRLNNTCYTAWMGVNIIDDDIEFESMSNIHYSISRNTMRKLFNGQNPFINENTIDEEVESGNIHNKNDPMNNAHNTYNTPYTNENANIHQTVKSIGENFTHRIQLKKYIKCCGYINRTALRSDVQNDHALSEILLTEEYLKYRNKYFYGDFIIKSSIMNNSINYDTDYILGTRETINRLNDFISIIIKFIWFICYSVVYTFHVDFIDDEVEYKVVNDDNTSVNSNDVNDGGVKIIINNSPDSWWKNIYWFWLGHTILIAVSIYMRNRYIFPVVDKKSFNLSWVYGVLVIFGFYVDIF